jgi:prefoldin subunit 5
MEEVYINVKGLAIDKYFNKDLVSVGELVALIEDLDCDIEVLNEQIKDIKQDIEDNYKPISHWEEYGLNPNDYH